MTPAEIAKQKEVVKRLSAKIEDVLAGRAARTSDKDAQLYARAMILAAANWIATAYSFTESCEILWQTADDLQLECNILTHQWTPKFGPFA